MFSLKLQNTEKNCLNVFWNPRENKGPYQDDKHLRQRTENIDDKDLCENKVPSVKRETAMKSIPCL